MCRRVVNLHSLLIHASIQLYGDIAQDRTQALTDASRRKERDVAQRDVDRLRSSIQSLTRSVNPLGKILDFLQEDVDAMQKELLVWRNESHENNIALQREQG